jgi:hypothetical protein
LTFEQLHHVVESASDRRLSRAYPIYELHSGLLPISRRSRTLAERQHRVFGALRQLGWPAYLRFSETPPKEQLPRSWGHAARETWAIPREFDTERLLRSLLTPGGWQLYLAAEPLDPAHLPDLYGRSFEDAFAKVEGQGIPAFVDAFPGNTTWRILLQPAAAAKKVAA